MSVGEALAGARGAAGLSVDEVSERTAIREIVIRSIERDDFESLGGDLYVRGYLRKIAGAVGIDPKPLIREFDATRSNGSGGWSALGTSRATVADDPAAAATGPAATPATPAEAPATPAAAPEAAEPADAVASEAEPETAAMPADLPDASGDAWTETGDATGGEARTETGNETGGETRDDAWDPWGAVEIAETESQPTAEYAAGAAGDTRAEPSWTEQGWTEPVAAESVWADSAPHEPASAPAATSATSATSAATAASASRNTPSPRAVPATRRPRRPLTRVRGWRWVLTITGLTVVVLAIVGVAAGEIISKVGSTTSASAAAARTSVPTAAPVVTTPPVTPSPVASRPASTPTPTRTAKPQAPVQRLPIKADGAFGPDGLADGDNPQSASFAIASHASAPWQTNWYTTADFGLLKHGTGLLLDMGKPVTITSVTLQLGNDWGASLQLRAGNEDDLSAMPVVASATDAGGQLTMRLKNPARARYILIWFVKLPPSGAGTYTGSVYSVTVKGRR